MFTITCSQTADCDQDEAEASYWQTEDGVRLDRILKPILNLGDLHLHVDSFGKLAPDHVQRWRVDVFRVALEGFTENIWFLIVVVAID